MSKFLGAVQKTISAGSKHTIAIKQDGSLWAWGINNSGQLGNSNSFYNNIYIPTQIGTDKDWKTISAGYSHTIAIKQDGTLWIWGSNEYGQLGTITKFGKNRPIQVGIDKDWESISAGYYHTIALRENKINYSISGTIKDNNGRYIGGNSLFISGGKIDTTISNSNGVYKFSSLPSRTYLVTPKPTLVYSFTPESRTITINGADIAIGVDFIAANVQQDTARNEICTWGNNYKGVLGDSTNIDKNTIAKIGQGNDWKCISSFGAHSIAVKQDGSLWDWGCNDYGQLGNGTNVTNNIPSRMGIESDWKFISAGLNHTIAIKQDNSLWSWGWNYYGQLGLGDTTNRNTPTRIGTGTNWQTISAGSFHTIAIKQDGSIWTWGGNEYGQLGNSTKIDKSIPTQIGTGNDWQTISAGYYHTIAIKQDGTLWAWGYNNFGQLGDNTITNRYIPSKIGTGKDWISTIAGTVHTIAIKQDGTLWAWGGNEYGQLGNGTLDFKFIPTQIGDDNKWATISAGLNHTIAIKQDSSLWAWGNNQYGQLGDGTDINKNVPIQIGTEYYWKFISAGGYHSTAIRQGRKLVTTNINNENEEKLHSNSNSSKIQLIPNPANSEVSIICNFDEEINNAKLKIYDMLGILVYEQNINSNTNTKQIISSINVTNFLNGTYNITIQSNNCMYHNVLKVLK